MEQNLEMPLYQSIKKVRALKISLINNLPSGHGSLFFTEGGFQSKSVSKEYMDKHKPYSGGYYVLYEDGYESFSPAGPFESGYIK